MQLDLAKRTGLPDALRVLVEAYPRETWEAHPNFDQLTQFWLDRHLMFRQMLAALTGGTEDFLDGQIDARDYAQEIGRMGQAMLQELHSHHSIEDAHYFPVLARQDARLDRGFEMLDRDHHALGEAMQSFADCANTLLPALAKDGRREAGAMGTELVRFHRFLDRHLQDEEELVVPVLLKYAPPEFRR
ncbi:hemerythrin domain-containing protein [Pontivivens ytuae]|uniref:Hemerythrin domain-containing protein n=1 Tax=Pontivivens ytuae TaxID=2789856 RepID=A0A7S9QCG8_9RHOB|nr:hemerythrin domain-containing protein [Pontivivens ytuae]QPH53810.1 hemerythrin domain-containing protein [Pontivivens ytuae]